MLAKKTWITDEVDLDKPNAARIYDYLLGGYHNFEADRQMAQRVIQGFPDVLLTAPANRAFLRRVVRYLATQGIDQFLDLGSGLPTEGNVHEIAQAINPAAHVVYVDIDPIAVVHSEAMLLDNPTAAVIRADVRRPQEILNHLTVRRLLDLRRPTAVLLIAILHLIPEDEEAYSIVRALRDALSPGSYIAIAHTTDEGKSGEAYRRMVEASQAKNTRLRKQAEIARFFDGLELVEPGLVFIPLWKPEGPNDSLLDDPERSINIGGIGRKV